MPGGRLHSGAGRLRASLGPRGYNLRMETPTVEVPAAGFALTDLRDQPWIMDTEASTIFQVTWRACRRAGFRPQVASESSQWDFMAAMVAADVGAALLPQTICRRLDLGRVRVVRLRDPVLPWDLALIWRRDRYLVPAARAFVEVVRRRAGAA